MKEKFRYYIQLEDGWYIQGQEDKSYGIPEGCDITVAKYFNTPEELVRWVKENTTLKVGDYMIYGVYWEEDNK